MDTPNLIRWVQLMESERDGTPETDATIDAALAELSANPDEFVSRILPAKKRVEQSTGTTMTPDDALTAMTAIESQRGNSGASQQRADELTAVLLTAPGEFWERYFTTPPMPGAMALLVKLGTDASLADLRAALESDARG